MMAESTSCRMKVTRGDAGKRCVGAVVITVTCVVGDEERRADITWAERVAWPKPWPEM